MGFDVHCLKNGDGRSGSGGAGEGCTVEGRGRGRRGRRDVETEEGIFVHVIHGDGEAAAEKEARREIAARGVVGRIRGSAIAAFAASGFHEGNPELSDTM
jgi:hypothetical protein